MRLSNNGQQSEFSILGLSLGVWLTIFFTAANIYAFVLNHAFQGDSNATSLTQIISKLDDMDKKIDANKVELTKKIDDNNKQLNEKQDSTNNVVYELKGQLDGQRGMILQNGLGADRSTTAIMGKK